MKEKIKRLLKNKYVKILITILFWLFIFRESCAVYVDIYNFRQLEKSKSIFESIPKEDYKFYTLKKFNSKYNAGIKPIKNCYYVSNDNWNELYIFWFKLESIIYRLRYLNIYYAYPKYDIPEHKIPGMGWDENYQDFIYTISNPCQD